MLHTEGFLKYFIGSFLSLILLINIIYAFNLVGGLGLPFTYQSGVNDYSDKYFGVSSLIDSFKNFFGANQSVSNFQYALRTWYSYMNIFDLGNLNGFQQFWGTGQNSATQLLSFLVTFFNLFINLPYTLMLLIYFLLFLFYVLMLIFLFVSYFCYLLSGMMYSYLPNTYILI